MKKIRKYTAFMLALLCGCSVQSPAQPAPSGIEITTSASAKPPETFVLSLNDDYEPPQTSSEAPEQSEPDTYSTAVIAAAGDTTQSDVFGEATSWRDMNYPFEDVAEFFREADLAFVNLETSVSTRGESEKKEGYGFRTDPKYLEVYTQAGIDIVSCANNHTRDFGMDALADTFTNLDEYGIRYVGAGMNQTEAEKLETFELNGIKVGFTAINMINMNPTWYATEERAGLNCVDSWDCERQLELIKEYDKQCDVLFVSVHWGLEYYNTITEEQQEFAHKLCDSGADIILGHHPHVLQPIEAYNGSVIFYSMGNFLFYKMDDDAGKTALFEIEIDKNGFIGGKIHPVFITNCKSVLLSEENEMYGEILELVRDISQPYGVDITENGGINLTE